MSEDNIALEIQIEYTDQELNELAERKGIYSLKNSRGQLINELLNLVDGIML
jgi:hypothetical protein